MKIFDALRRKYLMRRLCASFEKEDVRMFNTVLRNNYNKLLDDAAAGAPYVRNIDFESPAVRKAALIREAMDNGLSYDLLLDRRLTVGQAEEILRGLQNGLPQKKIKRYSDPQYNENQMRELRQGFENDLTDSQMRFFEQPGFSSCQMAEIRTAVENQLPESLIIRIAKPEMHTAAMRNLRRIYESNKRPTPSELNAITEKLCFASTHAMSCGLDLGLSPDIINGIIEKMTELSEYWDKKQYRELTREICEEISEKRISDLDRYFAQKFVTDQPELPPTDDEEKTNDPEVRQDQNIDIEAIDRELKNELGRQATQPQSDAAKDDAAEKSDEPEPESKAPAANLEPPAVGIDF